MALYRDDVLVLKTRDIGEADRLLVLFGRKRGKFTAVARGVRKLTSRKRGHLQTFNVCRIACAEGKSLDLITEADSRVSLDVRTVTGDEFSRMSFVLFVLNKLLPEAVPEPALFNEWVSYIEGPKTEPSTIHYVCSILQTLGFLSEERQQALLARDGLVRLRRYVGKIIESA